MISIDFDPTSLYTEIGNIKTAVFGSPGITNLYPQYNDTLDNMRMRLNNLDNLVMNNGDPLIVVKQKVKDIDSNLVWVKNLVISHEGTLAKFKNTDIDSIKEIVTQLKSIVENLNDIVSDPRFQNELGRMNELIDRIGD